MEDIRRLTEYEDRLAEVEYALGGLLARHDEAAHYLQSEMELLARECRDRRDRWAEVTQRAERILAAIDASHGRLDPGTD